MPGRKDANLRSGDRAEQIGVDILRDIAVVAEVPRTEDVGIDAVATLLRQEGRSLSPEHSFLVQFKSSSIEKVDYSDHELRWLFGLQLPLFLAWIEKNDRRIRLYSVTQHTIYCLPSRHFGLHPKLSFVPGEKEQRGDNEQNLIVGLGPPAVTFSQAELNDKERKALILDVLEDWVKHEQITVNLRSAGYFGRLRWSTNSRPEIDRPIVTAEAHHSDRVRKALQHAAPAFKCIEAQIRATGTAEQKQSAAVLAQYLEQIGAWT